MIHPHTEVRYVSDEKGYGVIAKCFIPKGTITWVQDPLDQIYTPEELRKMPTAFQEILDTYTYRDQDGNFVLCWDHGKYVNHSFKPNCMATAYPFEVAIRNIEVGEELTNDYGTLNITHTFRGVDEGTRRKVVYPNDLPKYYRKWDLTVAKTFPVILSKDQPLRPYISDELWSLIIEVAEGKRPMDSVLRSYFHE